MGIPGRKTWQIHGEKGGIGGERKLLLTLLDSAVEEMIHVAKYVGRNTLRLGQGAWVCLSLCVIIS